MKTTKTLAFGFNAVHAGMRNVNVEPQLIAVSTEGSFRITPPVSKALGLSSGDYIMFLNNISEIDAAIAAKADVLVDFCNENGLVFGSDESLIAIHKEFDLWAIAKGIQEFDPKGNLKTVTERLTKSDKTKYVVSHFDEMYAAALESAPEEVKDALTRDGVTKDEQVEILLPFVIGQELPKCKGSKLANNSGMSGTGVSLTFTDSNVWKQFKADMADDADKMNRHYDVDVDSLMDITLSNGFEDVTVKALIVGEYTDKEVSRSKEE